jgi:hypothetical protein
VSKSAYIKSFRVKHMKSPTWAWTWRCTRSGHSAWSWCGGVFPSWQECLKDLREHYRTEHDDIY